MEKTKKEWNSSISYKFLCKADELFSSVLAGRVQLTSHIFPPSNLDETFSTGFKLTLAACLRPGCCLFGSTISRLY